MPSSPIPDHPVACGFLLFREQEKGELEFLLMEHADRLDLPKGHLEAEESELQCALRELWEETAIEADALQIDAAFRYESRYPVLYRRDNVRRMKRLVIFLATLIRPVEIRLTEHRGCQWRRWAPPHTIQERTIDPLLAQVEQHFQEQEQEREKREKREKRESSPE